MRWTPLLLSAALLTVTFAVAAPATAGHCAIVDIEPHPAVPPQAQQGEAHVCDENGDDVPDTLRLQTSSVPSRAEVGVVRDQHPAGGHQDETTRTNLLVSIGIPTSPAVENEATVKDNGDDDSIERVDSNGAIYLAGPFNDHSKRYKAGLWDLDSDGMIDAWALVVCATETGCQAPGPEDLPEIDPNDTPYPVVYIEGVGYVP